MKIEDQVCSLELAKKLKELGVKQESLFYHQVGIDKSIIRFEAKEFGEKMQPKLKVKWFSAFTVAELGELLPTNQVQTLKWLNQYYCEAWEDVVDKLRPITRYVDSKEADARAKMLIYLLENKLITL